MSKPWEKLYEPVTPKIGTGAFTLGDGTVVAVSKHSPSTGPSGARISLDSQHPVFVAPYSLTQLAEFFTELAAQGGVH